MEQHKYQIADGEAERGCEVWVVEKDEITSGTIIGGADVEPAGSGPWLTLGHGDCWRAWPASSCYLRPWMILDIAADPTRGHGLARRIFMVLSADLARARLAGLPQSILDEKSQAVDIAEAHMAVAMFEKIKSKPGRPDFVFASSLAQWKARLERLIAESTRGGSHLASLDRGAE